MRDLIEVLRPYTPDRQDADAAESAAVDLPKLLRRFRAAGLDIEVIGPHWQQLVDNLSTADPEVAEIVLQVIEEALANALKHGAGTAVLSCTYDAGRWTCTVQNRIEPVAAGEAARASHPAGLSGGLGLGSMATRVQRRVEALPQGPTSSTANACGRFVSSCQPS